MINCKCGSYAINHNAHGRDGSDPDLCDVCYWRSRAEAMRESPNEQSDVVRDAERYRYLRKADPNTIFFVTCDEDIDGTVGIDLDTTIDEAIAKDKQS